MKLIKKIKLRPVFISLGAISFQTALYYTAKFLQRDAHLIGSALDTKIPFCNVFIIPYCSWYALIFIVPYYFYFNDKNALSKYIVSYVLCSICSCIIFIVNPTMIVRPILENNSLLNIITNFIYSTDTPSVNCMPSLHCAISMLFILTTFHNKNVSNIFKANIFVISILIMVSTLFVKQHVFIDFLTGITLMIYVYIFVINNKALLDKSKKLLRL